MKKLESLISSIRKENKIPSDDIIICLVNHIDNCDDDCRKEIYVKMYHKAYGDNLTKEIAHEWVHTFRVTDGSEREHGEKWTYEQTIDVGNRIGIDWNVLSKIDWYVVMNMEYSKHYDTAKAYGNESDPVWFAHIAKDEWCNKDKSLFDYYSEYVL